MLADLRCGSGLVLDEQVHLAYPPDRGVPTPLVLGEAARLRTGTVIYAGSVVGDRFSTGHNVVIREECEIGDDVSVWSNTLVDYGCRIGHRVKIHANCYIAQYTVIEDDAFMAPGVTFANDLYPGSLESAAYMRGPIIERGAQLGVNVTVLPYVRIGAGTIVGAGSVVVKDLPPGVIAVGSPAVPIRDVPDDHAVQGRVAIATQRIGWPQ
jgi:acetyltransferase-like isoleucine patch superfamily enzyme